MNNLPNFLINKLESQYGEAITQEIFKGYEQKRKVTLRVNTLKNDLKNVEEILISNNINYTKSIFWENALIIKNADEEKIRNLSIYNNGEIYFQSLSSMLPPIILNPKENEDILDMTAAPGGKTTEMAAISNNRAHITACEMNKIRFERLKYNIENKVQNVSFEKILLDAPCSGSGTINLNDKNLIKYFTEELIKKSIKSQKALINKAIKILKRGGELIYSTCSILQEENEDIISEVLKNNNNLELIKIEIKGLEKIPKLPTKLDEAVCLMPTEEYEGFFVAKIRKR